MICPHCHSQIPDGSNICPLCYSNVAGVSSSAEEAPRQAVTPKKTSYAKGSHPTKRRGSSAPTIIAVGLILILIVIIALIARSMFNLGGIAARPTPTPVAPQTTAAQNFVIFGMTATPGTQATPTPSIEVTPTPEPEPDETPVPEYKTLRKGDQGSEVVTLQKALAELGFLTTAQDGIYGTGTQTAVRNFQAANGLDADGIAGRQTQEALYSQSSVTPKPEATVGPNDILDLPG